MPDQDAAGSSGFGPDTTTDEVLADIDLTGIDVLVTGASAGLGQETARALSARGAHVIMAVRDPAKGESTAAAIRAIVPSADLELRSLDLASLASVRAFAASFLDHHASLQVLIANAGVMACPPGKTVDGFETQLGTNHLGHFLLTNLLTPALLAGAPSRVVVLTSFGHRFGAVDLDDPWFEEAPYNPWVAYGRSKTANALHAVGIDARLGSQGVNAWSVHPGWIQTELGRHVNEDSMAALEEARRGWPPPPAQKSVPAGAATSVWAATAPELVDHGGHYLEDCDVAVLISDVRETKGVMSYAQDAERADALWTWSDRVVGDG